MKGRVKLSALIVFLVTIFFASCTKNNEVTSISLDKSSLSLIVGQVDSVEAIVAATGDVDKLPKTWTSSIPTVASVKDGVITAKSSGTTVITVKAGEKTATCEVTVDDKIFPTLTHGQLWYWGDAYGTSGDTIAASSSNNFTLYLGSAGINLDDLSGNGEIVTIELNTPLTVKDSIPVGVYEMMSKLEQSQLIQYKIVPAFLQDGYQYGCWYYGKTINPVILGTVLVTRSGNIYKLVYELFDDYGVKISGTYQGELTYMDGTLPSTVRSSVRVNHQTSFKSPKNLIRR
jgi:hypothetical protein